MTLTQGFRFISVKTKGICLACLFFAAMMASCTKQTETNNNPSVPTPAPAPTITGDIQSFTLSDSLIAFNTGTTAKWLVVNINPNTIVKFNGVIVGNYGVLDTGPLTQNSTFTLTVNNGKQATASVSVADSITTLLWNKGKRLRQTKYQFFVVPVGQTDPTFVDTPMTPQVADQRINFTLKHEAIIIQNNSSLYVSPPYGGMFTVNASQDGFLWQGISYHIEQLSDTILVVTYDKTINGQVIRVRNTYVFE